MAAIYNLTINQGETFEFALGLTMPNGDVADLSDITPMMQIRASSLAETPILDLNKISGITVGANGNIVIHIPANITETLNFVNAFYDIELHHIDGTVKRILQGKVNLNMGITKSGI